MSIGRNDPAGAAGTATTLSVMDPMEHHPSQFRRAPQVETVCASPAPIVPHEIPDQDADCCSARPLFRVVLPLTAERRKQADLYLCGHHRCSCRASLAAANASIFDAAGRIVGNA
jgi:hypothetical protein